eukprot:scaffold43621_cov52-Attheya_sp.AAC.2
MPFLVAAPHRQVLSLLKVFTCCSARLYQLRNLTKFPFGPLSHIRMILLCSVFISARAEYIESTAASPTRDFR